MIFDELEVGDKFTVLGGVGDFAGVFIKVLPIYVHCCSLRLNCERVDNGMDMIVPGNVRVVKV